MIIAATLALGAAAPDAVAATGSISGTVTDFATEEPLEGIEVCANPTNWYLAANAEGNPGGCTHTGTDGTYTIGNLESENPNHTVIGYEVEFRSEKSVEEGGYFRQRYNEKPSYESGDKVPVTSGAVTGIDAKLKLPGRIEGFVSAAETGLPVEEVEVCAWDANGWETEGWIFRSCDLTAEDGSYAISISQAGEYEVEFAPPRTSPGLALQFFDQQARWEGAEVLSVGLSETITGVDASLHPGGTISGHVTRAINGQPLSSVQVCSIDASDDELWTCKWTEEDGGYELFSLSQGSYKVVFSPESEEWEELETWEDGFPTQFWDDQATLASANVISLGHKSVTGIDAGLGPAPPKPLAPPLPLTGSQIAPQSSPAAPKPAPRRKCGSGHKARKVRAHSRCVKRHPHKPKDRTHR
jgi:hypothetical protein